MQALIPVSRRIPEIPPRDGFAVVPVHHGQVGGGKQLNEVGNHGVARPRRGPGVSRYETTGNGYQAPVEDGELGCTKGCDVPR